MNRTEEEVWKLTPRKLQALLSVHYEVIKQQNGSAKSNNTQTVNGFIDTIPGW